MGKVRVVQSKEWQQQQQQQQMTLELLSRPAVSVRMGGVGVVWWWGGRVSDNR